MCPLALDPSIIIAESTTFSTEDVTQQVKLDVLSSKLISTVSVRTAYTGQGTPTVITALPQQSIVHHYYIAFNGIKPSMTGQYNVSIEMTDGTIVWSIFNISVSQSEYALRCTCIYCVKIASSIHLILCLH